MGSALIEVIAQKLSEYGAKNIVLDPVMVSTSGAKLISDEAIATLKQKLIGIADIITPNIPEAEVLCGLEIRTPADMEAAAESISGRYGCAVLLKGGHSSRPADDFVAGAKRDVALWERGFKPQHPRHRLHTVQRDCGRACARAGPS